MLTETTLPLESLTVVVTEPSALVVALLVVLEAAGLPPPDAPPPDTVPEDGAAGRAPPETEASSEVVELEAKLMLPLMVWFRLLKIAVTVTAKP